MASSTPNTILLQVNGAERPVFEKLAGAGTIKPGHMLAISSGNVVINPTAATTTILMVAVEHAFSNTFDGPNIDDAFASGDTVPFVYPQAGDLVYMWLEQGENVAAGARLESADGGELQAFTSGRVVGIAEAAADATSAAVRVKVRVA